MNLKTQPGWCSSNLQAHCVHSVLLLHLRKTLVPNMLICLFLKNKLALKLNHCPLLLLFPTTRRKRKWLNKKHITNWTFKMPWEHSHTGLHDTCRFFPAALLFPLLGWAPCYVSQLVSMWTSWPPDAAGCPHLLAWFLDPPFFLPHISAVCLPGSWLVTPEQTHTRCATSLVN